jgi:phage major head subunit gpT-like protein/phage head maturation protease
MLRFQAATLKALATNNSTNEVKVVGVAYTGGVLRASGWGDVVISLDGLKFDSKIRLLANHVNSVLAVVGEAEPSIENGALVIRGRVVGGTPEADRIIALLRAGVALGLSVGVTVGRARSIGKKETATVNGRNVEGPITIVEKGILAEVSIVAVPADDQASVRIAAMRNLQNGGRGMDLATFAAELQLDLGQLNDDQRQKLQAFLDSYRNLEDKVKEQDKTMRELSLKLLRQERPPAHVGRPAPYRTGNVDLQAHVLALAGRLDLVAKTYSLQVAEYLEQDRPRGWEDLARRALMAAGHADLAMLNGRELLRAAWSNTDLPVALTQGLNKLALDAFRESSTNWRNISKVISAPDFKTTKAIRLSAATKFELVPPGGELKHGDLAEDVFELKAATYGKLVSIDRTAIVNDDLGILQELPSILGAEGARTVSDLVFGLLNGAGADFFSAGNGNLLTGASSELSFDALAEAIKRVRTQKDRDGRLIGLVPTTLLVPAALEAKARQLLNSQQLFRSGGDQLPMGNPLAAAGLELVVEPRLDGASTKTWYLFARA